MKKLLLQHITRQDRVHERRLRKLANHLLHGQLGHEKFDLRFFNLGAVAPNTCGTTGCAIGECPIAFPRDWEFDVNRSPVLKGKPGLTKGSGLEFFGLTNGEFNYMFIPCGLIPDFHGATRNGVYVTIGKSLPGRSSKNTVAKRIIKFCDDKYGKRA